MTQADQAPLETDALQPGRINCQGYDWRAQIHAYSCHTLLLPGQPVLAVGRENLTLLVVPLHCILWDAYLSDEFSLYIGPAEKNEARRYEARNGF